MPAPAHPVHVLVIDAPQDILALLRELLEEEGYRVTTSMVVLPMDEIVALAPDVLVHDMRFEHSTETGWQFLTMVRLDARVRQIPVILCTAAVRTVKDPEIAERLATLGVRVVLKPFLVDDLLQALTAALGGAPTVPHNGKGQSTREALHRLRVVAP